MCVQSFVYQLLQFVIAVCVAVEDKNFALFNYVNEQNTQAVALKDRIDQVSLAQVLYR